MGAFTLEYRFFHRLSVLSPCDSYYADYGEGGGYSKYKRGVYPCSTHSKIFEYFRSVEQAVLDSTAQMEDVVISTGGGLPVWGDNMARIGQLGVSVYLKRSPENIISRLSPYGRQKRPKFRGLNDEQLLAFMHSHLSEREPIYLKADIVIDCDHMPDDEVIDTIMREIKNLKR